MNIKKFVTFEKRIFGIIAGLILGLFLTYFLLLKQEEYGFYPFVIGLSAYIILDHINRKRIIKNIAGSLLAIFLIPPILSEVRILMPQFAIDIINKLEISSPPSPTSEVVNSSRICKDDPLNGGKICSYKIGKDLEFDILGVGTIIATTDVTQAKPPERSDYSVFTTAVDPCIRIETGQKIDKWLAYNEEGASFILNESMAWLLPFNGIAYQSHDECLTNAGMILSIFFGHPQ